MLRRIMPPLLLFTAILFVFVKGYIFIKRVWLGLGPTKLDYIDLLKILLMTFAGAIAIRAILHERDVRHVKPRSDGRAVGSDGRTHPGTLASTSNALQLAFARRPVVITTLVILMIAIPLALWTLATGRSWRDFTVIDWILVCLAEAPIFFVGALAIFKRWISGRSS